MLDRPVLPCHGGRCSTGACWKELHGQPVAEERELRRALSRSFPGGSLLDKYPDAGDFPILSNPFDLAQFVPLPRPDAGTEVRSHDRDFQR